MSWTTFFQAEELIALVEHGASVEAEDLLRGAEASAIGPEELLPLVQED